MTKEENLNNPNSCLSKADMKEPIFVLRAKDPIAPMVIRIWASLSNQTQPTEKRARAYFESVKFEEWRKENRELIEANLFLKQELAEYRLLRADIATHLYVRPVWPFPDQM